LPVPVPASATSAWLLAIALGDALRHFHLLRPRAEGPGTASASGPSGAKMRSVVHGIRHGGRGMVARDHLYWPDLDVDLAVESIRNPERFPLVSRVIA
jgi:hypothetical protein